MAVSVKLHRVHNPGGRRRRRVTSRVGRNRMGRFVKVRAKRRTKARVNPRRKRSVGRVVRRRTRRVARRVNSRRRVRVNSAHRPRRRVRAAVPRKRRVTRRRTRKNPYPLLIELGAINPNRGGRRSKKVAKRRRSRARVTNTRRRRRVNSRRRRNPVAVTRRRRYTRRRRSVGGRRRRVNGRRRNPMGMSSSDMFKKLVGGVAGMAITKFLPTLVPASITGSNQFMGILVTAAGAFAAGMIADKVAGPAWGQAVLVGGLIQTGSTTLNTLAPSLASSLGVSGMGDIIPTQPFPVPNNQMRPVLMAAPASGGGMNGMGAGIRRRGR